MSITGFMPAKIVEVVANARAISIRFLRRASVLRRAFRKGRVAYCEIRFIAVNPLRGRQLTIRRSLNVLSFRLTRACTLLSSFRRLFSFRRDYVGRVRIKHLNDPLRQVLRFGANFRIATLSSFGHLYDRFLSILVFRTRHRNVTFNLNRTSLSVRNAILVIICRIKDGRRIKRVDFKANVRVCLANSANGAPRILILRVKAITPARRLRNSRVLLAQDSVLNRVGFNDCLAIFTMASRLTIRPCDGIKDNQARVRVGTIAFPINERHRDLTVEANMIITFLCGQEYKVRLIAPEVVVINMSKIAVAVRFRSTQCKRIHPL